MEENQQKPIKGIKIGTINLCMIFLSCILYILLIVATIHASQEYVIMVNAVEDYIACEEDASLVKNGSDYLTEQVRLYTVTMEREYVDAYFTEVYTVRQRDTGMEHLKSFEVNEKTLEYLENALAKSNNLMESEIYAIKLISTAQGYDMSDYPEDVQNYVLPEEDFRLNQEEMIAKARDLVFGTAYQDAKEEILDNISYFLNSIISDTMQKQEDSFVNLKRTMSRQQILISILFIENILTFILIIILVIKPLKVYIKNIEGQQMLDIFGSYEFKYLALTYNNIYELNAANEAMLHQQAEYDPLTGIINRGAFDRLRQLFKVKPVPLALLIVDVDDFKSVNDGYGHEMGDRVLQKVAKLLEESFRSSDYPARIGGDEFAVIITDVTPDIQNTIQEKVNSINAMLTNATDGLPKVSISVGGAFSQNGFADDLYNNADTALYKVKNKGKCGCEFYEQEES